MTKKSRKDQYPEPAGLAEEDQQWVQPNFSQLTSIPTTVSEVRRKTGKPNNMYCEWVLPTVVGSIVLVATAGIVWDPMDHEGQAKESAAALLNTCYDSPPSPLDNVIDKSNKTVFIMGASRKTVVRGTAVVDTLVACGAAQNIQIERVMRRLV